MRSVTPDLPSRRAHSRTRPTWARFDLAYARVPSNGPPASCKSSRSSRWAYCPPDVTAMTRAPPLRRSSGSRPETRTNGPTTIVANVASIPSGPSVRFGRIAPALSMTTSSRGSVVQDPRHGRPDRGERRHVGHDDREAVLAVAATSSSRTAANRPRSRPTRTTRAPSPASRRRPRGPARTSAR